MLAADVGQGRAEAALDHPARGLHRHHVGQRRAPETVGRAEFRPRSHQHRAAVAHILPHILEVGGRQDPSQPVAVEDDEVELLDLLDEQLARGKGDQRQLRDGDAILLLGRAQDGEMHQIHGRIGFQEVAPDPLARVRLARDEQHPQPVAHPVDLDDRRIVAVCQLVGRGRDLKLQHVHAPVRQRHRQLQILAHRDGEGLRFAPVDRDHEIRRCPRRGRDLSLILDPKRERHGLAQNGEGRRVADHEPPIPVLLVAGQQHMERRGHLRRELEIVDLPVGDEDGARHPRPRLFGQGLGERGHHQRALVALAVAHPDHAQLGVAERPNLGFDGGQRRGTLVRPVADALACALVHHRDHDVRKGGAVFLLQGRIGQRQKQHAQRQPAQPPARKPPPERHRHHEAAQRGQGPDPRPGQDRVEDESGHWPSLSRSAGTWT